MLPSVQKNAILYFSRGAAEEITHKRLRFRSARAAVGVLLRHSLRQVRRTKLPYFHMGSQQQVGNSFGERLANAVEYVFAAGYERVLIVGNDTPDLSTKLIQQAAAKFNEHSLVVGPANDGGIYLLGIDRQVYERKAFMQLAWETNTLQYDLRQLAPQAYWLHELSDIDTATDFWSFLRLRNRSVLARCLQLIVGSNYQQGYALALCWTAKIAHLATAYRRGPPNIIASVVIG